MNKLINILLLLIFSSIIAMQEEDIPGEEIIYKPIAKKPEEKPEISYLERFPAELSEKTLLYFISNIKTQENAEKAISILKAKFPDFINSEKLTKFILDTFDKVHPRKIDVMEIALLLGNPSALSWLKSWLKVNFNFPPLGFPESYLLRTLDKDNIEKLPVLLDVVGVDANLILILASHYGHKKIVETLIKMGAVNVNIKNKFGYTPLMSAAQNGHKEIVQMLLKAGADPNIKVNENETVLNIIRNETASRRDPSKPIEVYEEIQGLLMDAGAKYIPHKYRP